MTWRQNDFNNTFCEQNSNEPEVCNFLTIWLSNTLLHAVQYLNAATVILQSQYSYHQNAQCNLNKPHLYTPLHLLIHHWSQQQTVYLADHIGWASYHYHDQYFVWHNLVLLVFQISAGNLVAPFLVKDLPQTFLTNNLHLYNYPQTTERIQPGTQKICYQFKSLQIWLNNKLYFKTHSSIWNDNKSTSFALL